MNSYVIRYRYNRLFSFWRSVKVSGHTILVKDEKSQSMRRLVLWTPKGFRSLPFDEITFEIPEWNEVARAIAEKEAGQKIQVNN